MPHAKANPVHRKDRVYIDKGERLKRDPKNPKKYKTVVILDLVGRGRVINSQSVSMHPDAVARRERRDGGVYLSGKAPVQVKGKRLTIAEFREKFKASNRKK